jgi:redox-sensing transcriptional repressor
MQVVEQFARTTGKWRGVRPGQSEGQQIAGVTVMGMSQLKLVAAAQRIDAAVVAVRDEQAQRVANRLVEAGIGALLNLTAAPLVVPEKVAVQQADIATQLLLLSYRASLLPEGRAT